MQYFYQLEIGITGEVCGKLAGFTEILATFKQSPEPRLKTKNLKRIYYHLATNYGLLTLSVELG